MTTIDVARALHDLIYTCEIPEDFCAVPIRRVQTYEDAGLLTRDAGFVLTLSDGAEFQVTVVQSRKGHRQAVTDCCEIPGCHADAGLVYLAHGICTNCWNRFTANDAAPDALWMVLGIGPGDTNNRGDHHVQEE